MKAGEAKVETAKAIAAIRKSSKRMRMSALNIPELTVCSLKRRSPMKKIAISRKFKRVVRERPKNFPKTKSLLFNGLARRVYKVFFSISELSAPMAPKMTMSAPKNSMVESPTSLIIFISSPGVRKEKSREEPIKMRPKTKRTCNPFLRNNSLKLFLAITTGLYIGFSKEEYYHECIELQRITRIFLYSGYSLPFVLFVSSNCFNKEILKCFRLSFF